MSIRHFQGSFVVAMAALILSCASPTGTVPTGNGGGGGGGGGSGSGFSFQVTTNSTRQHVLAIWVETQGGTFVRTLGDWGQQYRADLTVWKAADTHWSTDAVTGATLSSSSTKTVSWNLTDRLGAAVAQGSYVVRGELVDRNYTSHTFSVPFTYDGTAQSPAATTATGFSHLQLTYTP